MQLKTISIKGKPYVPVNERIRAFRSNEEWKGWSMETEMIELTEKRVVMKAVIKDCEGRVRADGIAYEESNKGYINKDSFLENCQSSAWGRALGNLGIGIDTSIASAEEVQIAEKKRSIPELEDLPPPPEYKNEVKPAPPVHYDGNLYPDNPLEIKSDNNKIMCKMCNKVQLTQKVIDYCKIKKMELICYDCQKIINKK